MLHALVMLVPAAEFLDFVEVVITVWDRHTSTHPNPKDRPTEEANSVTLIVIEV